jgi:hypothetical protein
MQEGADGGGPDAALGCESANDERLTTVELADHGQDQERLTIGQV